MLMSGPDDVKKLGLGMKDAGLADCVMILGKDLSYPGERTGALKPVEAVLIAEKGLWKQRDRRKTWKRKDMGMHACRC